VSRDMDILVQNGSTSKIVRNAARLS